MLSGLCIGGPWHGQQRTAESHKLTALVHQSGSRHAPVYTDWKDAPTSYTEITYWHHVVTSGLKKPFALWLADGSITGRPPHDADDLIDLLASQIMPKSIT